MNLSSDQTPRHFDRSLVNLDRRGGGGVSTYIQLSMVGIYAPFLGPVIMCLNTPKGGFPIRICIGMSFWDKGLRV